MAKQVYIGINDKARKVKKMYIGVNGVARKVKKAYIGINGVARLFYDADAGGGWTNGTLPSSANWTSVAFGNGRFVAVASGSQTAAYSTNGINWTSVSLPSSSTWNCVRYCNGRFIAVSGANKAISSTDGITWTALTLPSTAKGFSTVGYNVEKGYYNIGTNAVNSTTGVGAYSTNGTTWKVVVTGCPVFASAYGNGKLIGVTTNTATSNMLPTCNQSIWDMQLMFPSSSNISAHSWYDIVYGTDRFVAVANSGMAAYSLTGSSGSFTAVTLPVSATFRGVAYGNGKFVAVANASNKYVFSKDGILWTAGEMPSSANWRSVAFGNGRFVAVAYGSDKAACLAA